MIEEAYVSFETAKLLKEKGFPQEHDIYHSMVYNEEDYEYEYKVQRMVIETGIVKAGTLSSYPVGVPEPKCYCPTQQMAIRWLREVHKIFIEVYAEKAQNFEDIIFNPEVWGEDLNSIWRASCFTTYEQAVEAAIQYCFENLI